jgi:Domain of unknown function (DUF4062)/prokaryotic YEATS domain
MIPVFVSSTFVDLKNHRTAVCEAFRQGGFLDVAMEHLGARDERPQDECLRVVKEESHYFIGIYAHRYGYIPDGCTISITEAEYEAAGDANLKRLIYIVDPGTPWVPNNIDSGKSAKQLERFKKFLGKRHIWKKFTTPDNLAKNVLADLGRVVRSAQLKPVDTDSSDSTAAKPWTNERLARYSERRYTELVHVIEPSEQAGQEYDILIYLFRHRPNEEGSPFGLDDVEKAEFYLGAAWNDRVFTCDREESGGYIGVKVSAYGTFMCLCRVTFTDGQTVILDRYIDFESERFSAVQKLTNR